MPLSNVLQFKQFSQISPINLDDFLPLSALKSREISLKIFTFWIKISRAQLLYHLFCYFVDCKSAYEIFKFHVGLRARGIFIIWVSLIFAHLRAGKFSRKFVVYFVLNIRFRCKIRKPIINFSRYILPIANVLIAPLSDKFCIQSRDF